MMKRLHDLFSLLLSTRIIKVFIRSFALSKTSLILKATCSEFPEIFGNLHLETRLSHWSDSLCRQSIYAFSCLR
jgi:hypothetical protein